MNKTIPELFEQEPDDELQTALKETLAVINGSYGTKSEAATVHVLSREHRTLQQAFMRNVIIPTIVYFAWAKENGHVDARNEATANLCAELAKVLKEKGDHLPYI